MFLKFGKSICLRNGEKKYGFYWKYSFEYTYFSEHYSESASVIKLIAFEASNQW